MRAAKWMVAGLCGLLGCGHTGPSEPAPSRPSGASSASETDDPRPEAPAGGDGTGTPIVDKPAALPPARLFYALAQHPERAELTSEGVHVLDFGEASGAQYTLGGWLTGAGEDHAFGEDRALLCTSKVVKLAVPIEHRGGSRLSLRVRSFAPTTLSLHLNGKPLADTPLDGKGFVVLEHVLAEDRTKLGENLLQLRVQRTGASPRGGEASVAIDWVRVSPAQTAHPTTRPSSLAELSTGSSERSALRVPAGTALAYTLEVPEGAELRAAALPKDGATLSISLERDGAPPEPLQTTTRNEALRIALGKHAGQVVRLSLRAEGPQGASVELHAPEVVIVDKGTRSAAVAQGEAPAPSPAKNVIVVLIDTLRADKLDAYNGSSRVKTPGLTTFLKSAAVMLNARTPENWTKPSVASLLSSLLPWQHNAYTGEAVVPQSVELLPELLRDRGYFTGAFIANGYVSDKFGFKQGWATYRNYVREGRRNIAQEVAADVVEWLDARPKDKPFFLYMHTIDPHVPYKPPKSFLEMYDPAPYVGPVDFSKTNSLLEKIKVGSIKLNERDKVRLEALYDGEISYHDVHFAATLRALEERGLDRDTVIVVTSDHGEELWDHGSVGHGHSIYDELLHIPLVLRIPGVTEGKQRLADSVSLVDVMPTVLDAIGQEKPAHLVGQSFLPELLGRGSSTPRATVSGFMQSWRTLGVGSIKLVQRGLDTMYLYDLASDPGETRDVASERPIALRYARGLLGITLNESKSGKSYGTASTGKPAGAKPQREHKEEKTVIDPETEAQLRALGYVGTSRR